MTNDPASGRRFAVCLADVLREETGYVQPSGGPYIRLQPWAKLNKSRVKRGLPALAAGSYTFAADCGMLRHDSGSLHALDIKPDGRWFDDDPRDRGGRTAAGILQREYTPWRKAMGMPERDVWLIEDHELSDIYLRQYWQHIRGDDLAPGVDCIVMHAAVLCGISVGAKLLQAALGVRADGHIGVATLDALANADPGDTIAAIAKGWRGYLRGCPTFADHGEGWLARVASVEPRARAMAYDVPHEALALATVDTPATVDGPVPSRRAFEPEPPSSMLTSTTGNAQLVPGTIGGGTIATEMPAAVERAASSPFGLTPTGILYALALSPAFWVGFSLIAAAAYTWLERRRHLITKGV